MPTQFRSGLKMPKPRKKKKPKAPAAASPGSLPAGGRFSMLAAGAPMFPEDIASIIGGSKRRGAAPAVGKTGIQDTIRSGGHAGRGSHTRHHRDTCCVPIAIPQHAPTSDFPPNRPLVQGISRHISSHLPLTRR